MSKALEALERMVRNGYVSPNVEELKIIEAALKDYEDLTKYIGVLQENRDYWWNKATKNEKKLKALEIIKAKRIETRIIFHTTNAMEYNEKTRQYYDCQPLTQEEFELLKEVLL